MAARSGTQTHVERRGVTPADQWRWLVPVAALVGGFLGLPSAADGQRTDSAAVHLSLVSEQARFEAVRRMHLPVTLTDPGARCEERIGRFCYWYDPGATADPRGEPGPIVEARHRLITRLADAAASHPGDPWIAGQHVRYLVEHGAKADAQRSLTTCAAAGWWCDALRGLTAHAGFASTTADSLFARALAAAPDPVRCDWTDLTVLLPTDARRAYSSLPCGPRRDSANALVWWLARPLHARAGNDLRAEHHARLTMAALLADARNPYGLRWGADLQEMLVRYGWSRWWTRGFPRPMDTARPISGHEPAPSFHFLPTSEALRDPASATSEEWMLDVPRAAHRYAPAWARRALPLPAQIGVFRRGDSALVVGGWDVSDDARFRDTGGGRWAGLAISYDEFTPALVDTLGGAPVSGRLLHTVAARPALASLELVAADTTVGFARHRTMITPPGTDLTAHDSSDAAGVAMAEFAVSAPLLLHAIGVDLQRATLDEVLPRMRHREEIEVPGPLALYWEVYGLPPDIGTPVRVGLTLHGGSRAWLRRMSDRVLGRTVLPPPRMAWDDVIGAAAQPGAEGEQPDQTGNPVGRLITVELPALSPGVYTLLVRVEQADGQVAEASRHLRVRRR